MSGGDPASPFPFIVPELTQVMASHGAGATTEVAYTNSELLQEGDIILVMSAADGGVLSHANTGDYTKLIEGNASVCSDVWYRVVGPTPPTTVLQINGTIAVACLAVTIRDSRGIRGTFEDYAFTSASSLAAAVATCAEANELVVTYVAIDDRNSAPGIFPSPDDNLAAARGGGTTAMATLVSSGAGAVTWPTPNWGAFGSEPIIRAAFSFSPIV